jgi:NAD-dependent dihydropyrimidine dehydrogenase PreA subunit
MSSQRFIYLRDVVTLRLDQEACTGCGLCLEVCPHAVFARRNGTVRVDTRDACMECGACARNCPASAITVRTGVGCAAAVISSALGAKSSSCSCTVEPDGVNRSGCQI